MAIEHDENSLLLKHLDCRTSEFRRNTDLEQLLEELSALLGPVEVAIEKDFTAPSMPPLFLVGNPRSGTSAFMQFLSLTRAFSVPTNLLSRFYYAPYLGAKIQLLLTDPRYDYKNEMTRVEIGVDCMSDIGKTQGSLSPSEFFHFWRRFIPNYDPEYLDSEKCSRIDIKGLRRGVAAVESVMNKPFAAKAIIIQYNLEVLFQAFPSCIILHMQRNPIYVMQSILKARERFYGDRATWWSVKPEEYDVLKDMDVYHQIAGQVYCTERSLFRQLESVPEANMLRVSYDEFCNDPRGVFEAIRSTYKRAGHDIQSVGVVPERFLSSDTIKASTADIDKLMDAYVYFERNNLNKALAR